MGPRDHMADPLLDQRGPTLGAAGGDEGRGPMRRRARSGVGGKEKRRKEQVGKGFGIVNKADVDAFLELSCFFIDPADVGNLISGSSAFPKTSLNFWKFTVHVLLKPGLENFEYYFTSV